jgi:hypothetical protein
MTCSHKKAAFRRPGRHVKKMHNSSDDVRVFLAVQKIIVEPAFEVRLVAGKLKNAIGVTLHVGVRVELKFDEHIPAVYIRAVRLIAVPATLDRSQHVPKFAIDMDKCAGLPKLYGIE